MKYQVQIDEVEVKCQVETEVKSKYQVEAQMKYQMHHRCHAFVV